MPSLVLGRQSVDLHLVKPMRTLSVSHNFVCLTHTLRRTRYRQPRREATWKSPDWQTRNPIDFGIPTLMLGIPTLKYRRLRGDLIEVFKIISDKDNHGNCTLTLHKDLVARGNRYKLYQKHVMIWESTFLLTVLLQYGTVYPIMLCLLLPLKLLKTD